MTQVLQSGRGTGESRRHTITCGACHCRFSLQENETRPKVIQKDWDGIWDDATIKVINCPECGGEVNAFPGTYF